MVRKLCDIGDLPARTNADADSPGEVCKNVLSANAGAILAMLQSICMHKYSMQGTYKLASSLRLMV